MGAWSLGCGGTGRGKRFGVIPLILTGGCAEGDLGGGGLRGGGVVDSCRLEGATCE